MTTNRPFDSNHIYSESDIRTVCPGASIESGKNEDNSEYEYLVATAEVVDVIGSEELHRQVEFCFVREGEGWKVDHTWSGFILVPKEEKAAD